MLAMLVAAAISATPASTMPGAPSGDTAAAVARALSPRENFRSMILMTLDQGDAAAAIAGTVGRPRADALLSAAAEDLSYRYADQWEANLAAAYRSSLSSAELEQALAALRRADRDALAPVSTKVAAAFFRNSSGLLRQVSAEAVRTAAAQASR